MICDNDVDDWGSWQVDYGSGSQPRLVSPSILCKLPPPALRLLYTLSYMCSHCDMHFLCKYKYKYKYKYT